MGLSIKKDTLKMGILSFKNKSEETINKALSKAGLFVLNNVIQGTGGTNKQPPIDTGLLWGSGSVFVDNKLIGVTPLKNGKGNPCTDYSGDKKHSITWGFNVDYAAKMHEGTYTLGDVSKQQKNAGKKFLEDHINADKELMLEGIAKYLKDNT